MRNFLLTLWYRYKSWRYERKCIKYFGAKPEKIYLPAEDYDALVKRLNEPPNPEAMKRFKEIMERRAPWDEN
jgi:hypothetical protein